MNFEIYERLEMDVTQFDAEDIITTSGTGGGTGGQGGDTPGGGIIPIDYELPIPIPPGF